MDTSSPADPLSFLYQRHRSKALAVVRRILRDPSEAEDVVQEVFARLCGGAGQYEARARYSTWLHRVMVNSALTALKARTRRERAHGPGDELTPSPEQAASARELQAHLRRALEDVDARYREVVRLRDVVGLSYPEIGAALRLPQGTVKSALHRGRSQLERSLERRGVSR